MDNEIKGLPEFETKRLFLRGAKLEDADVTSTAEISKMACTAIYR